MRIRVGWFPIAIISFLGSTALLLPAGRAEINKVGPQPTREDGLFVNKRVAGNGMSTSPDDSTAMPLASPFFQENFDGVTAPALPAGWTTDTTGSGIAWTTSTNNPDTNPNAAFGPETNTVGVTNLNSPTMAVPAGGPAQLQFRNLYNLEFDTVAGTDMGFDGMVLEISINGGAYVDILTAGGSFVTGGYNGTISNQFQSPLSGRAAWTAFSSGSADAPTYITTVVNLPAAASGQNIRLRWRVGSDENNVGLGQLHGALIDTVTLNSAPTLACTLN